jgi:hypothetical protein
MIMILPFSANTEIVRHLTVEELKAGIIMRQNLINRVQCDFSYSYIRLDKPIEEFMEPIEQYNPFIAHKFSTLWMDDNIRVKLSDLNIDNGEVSRIERFAWNGVKFTGYAEILRSLNSRLSGYVSNYPKSILRLGFWRTPLEQQVFDLDKPLAEVLNLADWKVSGPEPIGESSAWCIESIGLHEGHWRLKVWIDPEKDFAPVQMELRIEIDGKHDVIEKMTNVKLEKEDDVWVIKEAYVFLENPYLREGIRYNVKHFIAHHYRLNVEVKDDDFVMEFPRGTWVYDEIAEMGYIAGEGAWITHPDGKHEFVSAESLDDLQEMPALAMQEKENTGYLDLSKMSDQSGVSDDVMSNDSSVDNVKNSYFVYALLIIGGITMILFFVGKKKC